MPIDPSIALGYRGITAPNPLNQLSQVAKIQNAQQANQLNQMKIEEQQRAVASENALKDATKGLDLSTPEGQDAYGRALLSSGNIAEFQKFKTALATQAKAEREATTAQLNNAVTKTKLYNEGLTNVSDPQGLFSWYSQQSVDPHMQGSPVYGMKQEDIQKEILSNSFTQQKDGSVIFDPKKFNEYKTKLQLGTKDYLDNLDKQRQREETERHARASENLDWAKYNLQQTQNSPDYKARVAFAEQQGKDEATFRAKAPSVIEDATKAISLIDDLIGKPAVKDKEGKVTKAAVPAHPGISDVGKISNPVTTRISGSDAANFKLRLDEVMGGAFLDAYYTLKGGGAITEKEGEKATAAKTRMSMAQSKEEFIKAAREYQEVLTKGIEKANTRLSNNPYTGGAGTDAGKTKPKVSGKGTKEEPIILD